MGGSHQMRLEVHNNPRRLGGRTGVHLAWDTRRCCDATVSLTELLPQTSCSFARQVSEDSPRPAKRDQRFNSPVEEGAFPRGVAVTCRLWRATRLCLCEEPAAGYTRGPATLLNPESD